MPTPSGYESIFDNFKWLDYEPPGDIKHLCPKEDLSTSPPGEKCTVDQHCAEEEAIESLSTIRPPEPTLIDENSPTDVSTLQRATPQEHKPEPATRLASECEPQETVQPQTSSLRRIGPMERRHTYQMTAMYGPPLSLIMLLSQANPAEPYELTT